MPTTIDRYRLQDLMRHGAQLLEVLPADQFDEAHLPGGLDHGSGVGRLTIGSRGLQRSPTGCAR